MPQKIYITIPTICLHLFNQIRDLDKSIAGVCDSLKYPMSEKDMEEKIGSLRDLKSKVAILREEQKILLEDALENKQEKK